MNDTLKTIHSQRSTHGDFLPDGVSIADQETILAAAVRAPSASNRQAYSIIVVEDRVVMQELLGYQAGLALIFCNDTTRLDDLAKSLGTDYPLNPTSRLATGIFDAACAAQNAALAATSLGWGTLFTNCLHRGELRRSWRILGLPDQNCLPVIALLVGKPAHEGLPKKRWCGPGLVHRGTYQRLTPEQIQAQINAIDHPEPGFQADYEDYKANGFTHRLSAYLASSVGGPAHDTQHPHPLDSVLMEKGFTFQSARNT
jgi:FMN reductase [NAD(P)H]